MLSPRKTKKRRQEVTKEKNESAWSGSSPMDDDATDESGVDENVLDDERDDAGGNSDGASITCSDDYENVNHGQRVTHTHNRFCCS